MDDDINRLRYREYVYGCHRANIYPWSYEAWLRANSEVPGSEPTA